MTALTTDPVTSFDRLAEIAALDLFSPRAQVLLDRFARQAAQRLGLPVGLVTIILDDAQVMAGAHGLVGWMAETRGVPLEWSFCRTPVQTGQRHVITNAAVDATHRDNPLVTVEGVRSYAGSPLVTSRGQVLGTCCVLGSDPREFTADELHVLDDMAAHVVAEIEATRDQAQG
jgi:GAF domain-containing protein